MPIDVGDLVRASSKRDELGVVIEKRLSVEGLSHVQHMISSYPLLYYVFFADDGRTGPFYADDLTVV